MDSGGGVGRVTAVDEGRGGGWAVGSGHCGGGATAASAAVGVGRCDAAQSLGQGTCSADAWTAGDWAVVSGWSASAIDVSTGARLAPHTIHLSPSNGIPHPSSSPSVAPSVGPHALSLSSSAALRWRKRAEGICYRVLLLRHIRPTPRPRVILHSASPPPPASARTLPLSSSALLPWSHLTCPTPPSASAPEHVRPQRVCPPRPPSPPHLHPLPLAQPAVHLTCRTVLLLGAPPLHPRVHRGRRHPAAALNCAHCTLRPSCPGTCAERRRPSSGAVWLYGRVRLPPLQASFPRSASSSLGASYCRTPLTPRVHPGQVTTIEFGGELLMGSVMIPSLQFFRLVVHIEQPLMPVRFSTLRA